MKELRKLWILIWVLFIIPVTSLAQVLVEEESTFKDRLYFGGNFGLQLGQFVQFVEVSPLVGYMFNNRFSAGAGIIYNYFRTDYGDVNDTHIFGSRQFGRYNITPNLFGYAEVESISFERSVLDRFSERERFWVVSPFIGLGYVLPIGPRAAVVVTGLYNLNYRPDRGSPYPRPWIIRLGFTF